jgi:hypothetical protein
MLTCYICDQSSGQLRHKIRFPKIQKFLISIMQRPKSSTPNLWNVVGAERTSIHHITEIFAVGVCYYSIAMQWKPVLEL